MMLEFDFSELEKKLNEVSKKVGNTTLDKALKSGADVTIDAMKKTVPVDTGQLRDSLGIIKKSGTGMNRQITVGITGQEREIIERGYYQEHGTRRMVGKKWMKKASENSEEDALDSIKNTLAEEIKW